MWIGGPLSKCSLPQYAVAECKGCLAGYLRLGKRVPYTRLAPGVGRLLTTPIREKQRMSYSRTVIESISQALSWRVDETVLRDGGTFEEFQAAAVASYKDAPLGEETAPASCRTVAVHRAA